MIKKLKSFLLENKTDKQTVIKNSFWMILSEGFSKGGMFLISIFIARILGPEQFGIMSFVTSFVSMFVVLTDFGLTTLMVREVSKEHTKIHEYLINLGYLKLILGIITFLIVWIISMFIGKNDFYISLILIYTLYSILNNFGDFIRAFFRPSENMQYEALLKIINGVLVIIIVGFMLYKFGDLISIFYGFLLTGLVSLLISIIYVSKKIEIGKPKLNKDLIKKSFKSGIYLMGSVLFVSIFSNIDKIILGYFGLEHSLGIYTAISRIIGILGLISGMFILSIMPNLVKKRSKEKVLKYLGYLLILPVLTLIIGYLFGNNIIYILYGKEYLSDNSFVILMILMIMFLFNVINTFFFYLLNYIGIEKGVFYMTIITGILSIFLNFILIPILESLGAVITSLVLEILMSVMIVVFYRKKIFMKS